MDHLLESKTFENAQKLADDLAKSQLSLDKLCERAEEYDLTDSAVCYSTFDVSSSHVCGTTLDLFTEHDELNLDTVLDRQHWFLLWASDSDIQSGQWLSQLVLTSLKPDLVMKFHERYLICQLNTVGRPLRCGLLWTR